MKRWLIRIFVCLILGAVATVGVSLAALFTERHFNGSVDDAQWPAKYPGWKVGVMRSQWRTVVKSTLAEPGAPTTPTVPVAGRAIRVYEKIPAWCRPARVNSGDVAAGRVRVSDAPMQIYKHATGWPLVALRGALSSDPVAKTSEVVLGIDTVFLYKQSIDVGPVIPTRPIWPNFTVNTVFWGLLILPFLFVPGWIRSWRRYNRTQRGQCAACGYGLDGLAAGVVCPECSKREDVGAG